MAIPTTTVWEVRTTGNDSNGGGFDPVSGSGHTDYSQQDSPQLSRTDVVTTGSTTVTSATGGFTSAMIGNAINITGDGVYFITAVGSSTSITVDRTTGTATGQTGKVGGAFGSPGMVGVVAAGAMAHVKSGTYTISSSSQNVSGGYPAFSGWGMVMIGYGTTRLDYGTKPTLKLGVGTVFGFQTILLENFAIDTNGTSGTFLCYQCRCRLVDINVNGGNWYYPFYAGHSYSCSYIATNSGGGNAFGTIGGNNVAINCNGNAFVDSPNSGNIAIGCLYGFVADNAEVLWSNCIAINCTNGFYGGATVETSVAIGCTTGFVYSTLLVNCFGYNNTTDYSTIIVTPINFTHLTSSPYTDPSTYDFSLTTYGKTTLLGAGAPNPFPLIGTANYRDAGPFQHQDSGGGGSTYAMIF